MCVMLVLLILKEVFDLTCFLCNMETSRDFLRSIISGACVGDRIVLFF